MENISGAQKNQERIEISARMRKIREEKIQLQDLINQKVAPELEKMKKLDTEYDDLDRKLKS